MFEKTEKYLKKTAENAKEFVTEHPYTATGVAILIYGLRCKQAGMKLQRSIDSEINKAREQDAYDEGFARGASLKKND